MQNVLGVLATTRKQELTTNYFQKSLLISGDISTRWQGGSAVQAGLISFSLTGLDGAHRRCGCTALHVPHWLLRAPPGAPSVAQCAGPSRGGRARAPRSARCSGRGAPARGSACLRARPRLLRALAGRRSLASRGPSSTARAAAASAGFLGCVAQPLRPLRRGLGREARLRLAPSRAGGRISAITRAHRPANIVRRYAPFWARGLGAGACAVWFR